MLKSKFFGRGEFIFLLSSRGFLFFLNVGVPTYLWMLFYYLLLFMTHFRSSNGCKRQLNWTTWETSPNGKTKIANVMSRDNRSVRYQTLAHWQRENYRERQSDCSRAWNVLTITHGFWIPRVTGFPREKDEMFI